MFCRVIYLNKSLQPANVLISQTAKRYKYHMRKIHNTSLLHRPRGTCNLHRKLRLNLVTLGDRYLPAPIPQRLARSLRKAPVRHTLQPLCDLSATDNFNQSQRSQQGPRSVPARLQRSRRLVGDLAATKSVAARFLNMLKRLVKVADQSPISRRPIAD